MVVALLLASEGPRVSSDDRLERLLSSYRTLRQQGRDADAAELCRDCPDLTQRLRERIEEIESPATVAPSTPDFDSPPTRAGSTEQPAPDGTVPLLCEPAHTPTARIPGYEMLDVLGRGGMGVVYKARHVRLNRVVALKMILHGDHAGAEARLRFLTEAETVAAIRHPGIVQVFDFGTHAGLP